MRKFLILTFCLLPCLLCFAQQSRQYVFTHLTASTGLASNVVSAVVQDKNGYIWIGTINGLQRYDGNKFLTFRNKRNNPRTIPNDQIERLHIDRQGRLWVICAGNQVGIFNTGDFTFREIPVQLKGEIHSYQADFLEFKDGRLSIIFRKHAMVTYHERDRLFAERYNVIQWPAGWKPNHVFIDTAINQYWMCGDSGLVMYDPISTHFNRKGHNTDRNPIIEQFADYNFGLFSAIDREGRLWYYRWIPLHYNPELYCVDLKENNGSATPKIFPLMKEYHEINGMTVQRNGKVWFWGEPLIAEYNPLQDRLQLLKNKMENPYSLYFDVTNCFFEDREENLWLGTNNGVFIFNPTAQMFNNLSIARYGEGEGLDHFVSSFVELSANELWVSTWGDGIYSYDTTFRSLVNPVSNNPKYRNLYVFTMYKARDGRIWMACQFGQTLIYDPATKQITEFVPASIEKRTVRQIIEDRHGNIWMGTQNGHLVKWNISARDTGSLQNKFRLVQNLKSRILKLYIDNEGFLWVGTNLFGAYKMDPETGNIIAHYKKNDRKGISLMAENASDFSQYNDSIMLIASGSLNTLNMKTGRISFFGTEDGLPSNNILNIVKDTSGFYWFGLYSGLCRFNFEKKVIASYSSRNGIINDNFQQGAVAVLNNGRIVMGTNHDFLTFQPSEIARSEISPSIEITGFKVVDSYLPLDSLLSLNKITLQYYQNPVSIEFSSLSYRQQNQLTYYYQLDGIDKDWIRSENNNIATYAYLPPGSYTFTVRCDNGNGDLSPHITSLVLYVQPPLWKSWWFYAILLLFIIGILYLMDRERINRMLQLQEVRTQIAGNLHKDVNTTLNNINLLSEIAKIKVDKDITKSKEYIDQINSKSRKMIDDMDDMLWSIDPQNDSMQKTLERMIEFAEGLRSANPCEIDVIVDDKVRSLKLSMKVRHEMFLIFKTGLSNIAENPSCTSSVINIDLVKYNLLMKIWDKRKNYDPRSYHHHIELEELRKRAAEINGTVDIHTDREGISIMVQIPIH